MRGPATTSYLLAGFFVEFLIEHHDGHSSVILSSAPSPPAHLDVLPTAHPSLLPAIPFSHRREDHGSCRHVQSHSKSLCRKQALDQLLLKQHLNHLLDDGKQARVVDPNPTFEKGKDMLDSSKVSIPLR